MTQEPAKNFGRSIAGLSGILGNARLRELGRILQQCVCPFFVGLRLGVAMPRWKKLDGWEERLGEMTVEELEKELIFWKDRLQLFQPKVRKLAMKQVHTVEKALDRKRSEDQETSTRT